MKRSKIITVFIIMAAFFLAAFQPSVEAAPKRIGIVKFECDFQVPVGWHGSYEIGSGAADLLAAELFKNKNYQIYEREQLQAVLNEQGFGASGAVDPSTAVQMGKLAGLDYIVYGKVASAGKEENSTSIGKFKLDSTIYKVVATVRMIDVQTGALVVVEQAEGVETKAGGQLGKFSSSTSTTAEIYDQALGRAISTLAKKIHEINPIEGTVAHIAGKTIYLDIGVEQGVTAGQKYKVYREGRPIMNARGEIIGVTRTDVAKIKVTSVEGNMSICKPDGGDDDSIQVGDKVKML